jgi:DNA repair exonuclease SbcCD nuclease subunit
MLKKTIPKFNKIAMFTDIHFGARQNAEQHNIDCIEFVDFFIQEVKKNNCDTIFFLGDWFESRSSLSVMTINYSLRALRQLDAVGIPVFIIVGNHDLFYRNTRDMHSTEIFREFKNITIVDEPLSLNEEFLLTPFLFKEEYAELAPIINQHKYVFGHFEFRNFYLTGSFQLAEHGFLHKLLNGPKYIFSGHYHKRQASDNTIYIGNPFATSYSDVDDNERGMTILDLKVEDMEFINYAGPTFIKTTLSKIVNEEIEIKKQARVRCLLDLEISYSEAQSIKNELMQIFELREFILEQNTQELQESITESSIANLDRMDLTSINDSIIKMIMEGITEKGSINPKKLVEIYEGL